MPPRRLVSNFIYVVAQLKVAAHYLLAKPKELRLMHVRVFVTWLLLRKVCETPWDGRALEPRDSGWLNHQVMGSIGQALQGAKVRASSPAFWVKDFFNRAFSCLVLREMPNAQWLQVELAQKTSILEKARLCGSYAKIISQELLGTALLIPYGEEMGVLAIGHIAI